MINNPIINGKNICDSHCCVVGDYVYMSVGVDVKVCDKDYWAINYWEIYRTKNLVDWEKVCEINPKDIFIGETSGCWATDIVYKNGTFYFYFSLFDKLIGVLTSKNPENGFEDVLKKPLIPERMVDTRSYDPTIFTDIDGTSYIVFGCRYDGEYHIARLNDDMISLAEEPKRIEVKNASIMDDKNYIHRVKDTYILTYSGFYATSKNLYGPYEEVGNAGTGRDHTAYFSFKGQDFCCFTLPNPNHFIRGVGITYIQHVGNKMYSDGLINEYGVGYYNAGWNIIECEWFLQGENVDKKVNHWGGIDVVVNDSSILYYPNIQNINDYNSVSFYGNSVNGLTIYIHDCSENGEIISEVTMQASGGEVVGCYYKKNTADKMLSKSNGIYLTFKGEGKIDYFKFYGLGNSAMK